MRATNHRLLRLLSAWLLAAAPAVSLSEPKVPCQGEVPTADCPASADPAPSHPGDEAALLGTSVPATSLPHSEQAAPNGTPNGGGPDPSRLETGLTWDYCGSRPARLGRLPNEPPPGPDTPVDFSADALDYDQNSEVLTLRGAIKAQRGNQLLEAEDLRYDRRSDQIWAKGDTLFANPQLRILGTDGEFNLTNRSGKLDRGYYRLIGNSNARGSAAEAKILDDQRSEYRDARYTTCPPGDPAWELRSNELAIDRETGTGTTWHTTLRVGDVPLFYWPYLSFPIDGQRKSGFLIPTIGTSSTRGLDLKVPYYFNLAPNMDFTFAPRVMSKRGLMLEGEFRYLTNDHRGKLYGEILPRDLDYQDKTRGAVSFTDRGILAPGWTTDLSLNYVSDDSYLDDFGNNLQITSQRNLERRGDVAYRGQDFYFRGRLLDFQTVDATLQNSDRPYTRLPQLLALYDRPKLWSDLDVAIGGEYDYFGHETLVHGQRFSVRPALSWPFRASYGYLKPSLILNHSSYSLTGQAPGQTATPSYTIPSASLDGTLVLERPWSGFGPSLTQTLEPRLYYLYTPYRNQTAAPLFDSVNLDISFANLFRDNRFTGRDRIGDANQLTLGLTSRGLSQTSGAELYRASIGQTLYFADRRVQINNPTQRSNVSPFVGEIAGRITEGWRARAGLAWDPDSNQKNAIQRELQLRYQGPDNLIFNATYRYNHDTQRTDPQNDTSYEDTELSFRWPVSPQLDLVGRWYYSLLYSETMDTFAGVEYGRCCWRVRAVARRFKNQADQAPSNGLLLQVELAGLGQLGQRIDRLLERTIYGYRGETTYGDLDQ